MPYTKKEKKLWRALVKEYGREKAERVYHAMLMSGKWDKIFGKRSKRWRKRRKRRRRR